MRLTAISVALLAKKMDLILQQQQQQQQKKNRD